MSTTFRNLALAVCAGLALGSAGATAALALPGGSPIAAPTVAGPDLGPSAVAFRPDRVRRILSADGYTDIEFLDDRLPVYIVRACRRGELLRLRLNRFGEVRNSRTIGTCGRDTRRPTLAIRDIERRLERLGYTNVSFLDRDPPLYLAEACRGGDRYRLRIDEQADIEFRVAVGPCRDGNRRQVRRRNQRDPNALRPSQIRRLLTNNGFTRVQFIDRRLPNYVVEACRGDRRFRLTLQGDGRVRQRDLIGRCDTDRTDDRGLSIAQIEERLAGQRYYNIRFTNSRRAPYEAEACRNARRFTLRVDAFGQIRRRTPTGNCRPPRRNEVSDASNNFFDLDLIRSVDVLDPVECQDYLEFLLRGRTINFATNSADINRDSFELLDNLAFVASRCPRTRIEVAGHTDSVGSEDANQALSERRARSVVDYLVSRDVRRRRLAAVGYGERFPIADNDTSRGRAANRRIEFVGSWSE